MNLFKSRRVLWFVGVAAVVVAAASAMVLRPAPKTLMCCKGLSRTKLMAMNSTSVAYAAETSNAKPASATSPEKMSWIPGGEFSMGAADPRKIPQGGNDPMNDARPIRRVYVDGFWMDQTEVTNEQFEKFVNATGYKTIAERKPTKEEFPTAPEENLVAGSIVFTPAKQAVPLNDHYQWWNYVHGADWRHPEGPKSTIKGRENYPVVQIAYEDAAAYAKWAGKRMPTEAEWEFAARGGLVGKPFVWGDEFNTGGKWMANTYQGHFPIEGQDKGDDGFKGIAPVKQYPPNGYGLYDVAGNVWEWCSDWYRADYYQALAKKAAWPKTRKVRLRRWIPRNQPKKNASIAADLFSAPSNIAAATWSEHGGKAKSVRPATMSDFGA